MKMKLKKILINITAAVCICISLTGCTKVNENLSAKDIQKSIVETGLVKNMEETGSKGLKRYYGLNSSDFDSVVLYTPESSMEVDEMLIVLVHNFQNFEVVSLLYCQLCLLKSLFVIYLLLLQLTFHLLP